MDLGVVLPRLLLAAWLLPLASFTAILFSGRRLGKAGFLASYVATAAILGGFLCSLVAFVLWLSHFGAAAPQHGVAHSEHAAASPVNALQLASQTQDADAPKEPAAVAGDEHGAAAASVDARAEEHANEAESHAPEGAAPDEEGGHDAHADSAHAGSAHPAAPHDGPAAYSGDWYVLGQFGRLRMTVGYYIDALTVCMFAMVTLIASCIHFYAIGYMHDELHDVEDHEVTLSNGHHLHRRGRFHRFFQYLSLFCFSMLGLVIAGNIAMVFVFWELVGVCSYFLIGFYIERKSASNAANKAFIVNRVGDFGMIIGLMALWSALGTFSFGDTVAPDGSLQPGLFSQVRTPANEHRLDVPDGMLLEAARADVAGIVSDHVLSGLPLDNAQSEIAFREPIWRAGPEGRTGYWLLVVAGLGIFCGCVGKSAQFPLHVWLPDAMEGPTPVSALVHSATMVAAGVYLVGRFFPVFAPEVLLTIAYVGMITLFLAATIAITAVDIKRVLAYSTVSQLGYMMLALGIGGWAAGLFHLITHAFFKSLLFMCSGSVIHACHTNDMTKMGGLRHKMPYTAYTMLVGCLAIIGAGIPFVIGFSGYYSKDSIIAQAVSFARANSTHGTLLLAAAAGGAALTAFYMFRLWYLTFAGQPRDHHVYDHAHESPPVMYVPLLVLSVFAAGVAWQVPFTELSLTNLLEQARPAGEIGQGVLLENLRYPDEHASHAPTIHATATVLASATALGGFLLATVFYCWRLLSAEDVRRQFSAIYRFLINKWWFDELYQFLFVKPTHFLARLISGFDTRWIDGLINRLALGARSLAHLDDLIDRWFVDGSVNVFARWTYSVGAAVRGLQTGKLRQYVVLIVVATVLLSVLLQWAAAGQ